MAQFRILCLAGIPPHHQPPHRSPLTRTPHSFLPHKPYLIPIITHAQTHAHAHTYCNHHHHHHHQQQRHHCNEHHCSTVMFAGTHGASQNLASLSAVHCPCTALSLPFIDLTSTLHCHSPFTHLSLTFRHRSTALSTSSQRPSHCPPHRPSHLFFTDLPLPLPWRRPGPRPLLARTVRALRQPLGRGAADRRRCYALVYQGVEWKRVGCKGR